MLRHLASALLFVLPQVTVLATAQWSSDPALNLALGDGSDEQAQPKLAAERNGGAYLAWFDNSPTGSPAFGYDVRLQRVDSAGVEQWAHNGVLVADRGFSSTVDYDLAVDGTGDALLAFNDDRFAGDQISAARFDASGNALWGASGVQLTSTLDFVANPKIVGTSDGAVVVAWIQAGTIHLQRLDASGAAQWSPEVVLTPAAGSYSTADLDASTSGACILAFVHQTGGFSSPKHLRAQRFDALGAAQWGASGVAVWDGGSLQFGNFPECESDGAGGAVFAWYSAGPTLQCFAQRVNAAGSELFAHNGVELATTAGRVRVAPSLAYDASTRSTYVAWNEKSSNQSLCGVSAQKLDNAGVRQWTNAGVTLVALGADAISDVQAALVGGHFGAFWNSAPAFGQDVGRRAILDSQGALVVAAGAFSSTPAVKFDLDVERSAYGSALLAWRDERGADPDVYVQNVLPHGALGQGAGTIVRNGTGANTLFYTSVSEARLGMTWQTSVSHAHHPGATSTLVFGSNAPATSPVLAIGQVLVGTTITFTHSLASSGSADLHSVAIPLLTSLIGRTFYTQAAILGGGIELGNALDVTAGL